jgi:two-component system OmpR family sensor kinase
LRRTLEAERGFIANSAHELRTPLASALAQLERLDGELPDETHRARGRRIEATLRGLARVSEKLIQLAKAEGGSLLAAGPGDLNPILELVVNDFRETTADIRLHRPPDAVLSRLDPDAFAILTRNLVDNAVRHGDPEQPVEVTLSAAGELRVVNGCAPLQPSALAHLRERFVRGREDGEGSGLGLAIADAIVAGADLRMQLNAPATGRDDGFEVVVAGLLER